MLMSRKLDIMSFGDLQAQAMGVDSKKTKICSILICALLTGVSVAFTGVIGFVDLAAPHVVRKIFGPSHKLVLPMSFIYGGAFMALCDLISRTLLSPREIPVGAVTALIGAPFFAYVFFASRRKRA
jgi:iron complex transport system permease protein